jgi:hypothetical protein
MEVTVLPQSFDLEIKICSSHTNPNLGMYMKLGEVARNPSL